MTTASSPTRLGPTRLAMASWIGLVSASLAVSCAPPAPQDGLQVAVSVPPQAYFVDQIAGGRVSAHVMVPPGSSPATYELTPRQMLALGRSRLYVAVGHPDFPFEKKHLEGFRARHEALQVIEMTAGMTSFAGDPHVWLSPPTVALAAKNIAQALARVDPEGREIYEKNLATFLTAVEMIDAEIATILDHPAHRGFLVQHPAWGSFAERYGLEQMAIESDGKEPSPGALARLVERSRREGIAVVFVQEGFADRSARVIAREIGAKVVVVDPLAYDWLTNLRAVASAFKEALGDG
jgi:zinc transport system substrate-binding protein